MIAAPVIKTRRNKEEIAAYERGRQAMITSLAALVSAHWDGMNEAATNEKGFRVIVISLGLPTQDKQEGFVAMEYQRAPVEVSRNFVFDDGQRDLPGVGGINPPPDAPPAPGAFGPATTEPAPAETSTAPAVAPAAIGKGGKGK